MSTPSTKKPEQAALLEVAAREKPEREETKSSARFSSPRPFREWQPGQGQLPPRDAREVLGEGHRRVSSSSCARCSTSAPF
ncbi:hypothetical protein ACN28S_31710 [Cystobacter fuscus]